MLTKAYAITEDPGTIDWSTVPRNYVCKATHGSGGVIVVNDHADPDARLPTGEDGGWRPLQSCPNTPRPSESPTSAAGGYASATARGPPRPTSGSTAT